MFIQDIPSGQLLYIMLYGGAAMAALIAFVYLLLRRGNAFAPDVTPPLAMRRWAVAFFAVACLGHFWWLLLYFCSNDINSVGGMVVSLLDCVGLLTTIAGTLFAMLQDRKRPVWPVVVAILPYAVLLALNLAFPDRRFYDIAIACILLFYVLFIIYMMFAVRQYRQWLRDNYADLEHKEVRQSYMLIVVVSLLLILFYMFDTRYMAISFIVQAIEIPFFGFLLWRVETLQQLDGTPVEATEETPAEQEDDDASPSDAPSGIGQLLKLHCEGTQLYLQHDLSLSQLSQAIGTNHYYLSQYFTQQGLTYNAYINGLRIRHFVNLYNEAVANQRSFTAQQLASESGFRRYNTFSNAFKQRMGQTVTAWMRGQGQ